MYADFQVIFSSKTFKKTANIRIFNAFFERIWAETMDEKLRAGVFERIPSIIINPAGDYTVTFHVTIPGVHSETNVRSFLGRFFIQNTQKTANIRIFNAFFERIWPETMDEKLRAEAFEHTPIAGRAYKCRLINIPFSIVLFTF